MQKPNLQGTIQFDGVCFYCDDSIYTSPGLEYQKNNLATQHVMNYVFRTLVFPFRFSSAILLA